MCRTRIAFGGLLSLCIASGTMAQSASVAPDSTDADVRTLDWMAQHASATRAIDHGADERDLARWDSLTANARVIGLGEQTHGSSEFSRMKLRLIEHGIRSQHVTVIGLENTPAAVAAINGYLHGEAIEVDSLIAKLSRLWRTEEVKSVVTWLRGFNDEQRRAGKPLIDMIGIDVMNGSPARDSGMAESIAQAIAQRPAAERAMFWAHNVHVSYLPARMGVQLHRIFGPGYVALGFGTAQGTYRAHAPSDPQPVQTDGHELASPTQGSVELNLATLSPRVGGVAQLYDFRAIVADTRGTWLSTPRSFRHVGTNAAPVIQVENIGAMFDLLMFIPTTTSSRSIPGIQ